MILCFKISAALGIDYCPGDIQVVHRIPSGKKEEPLMFIVQFVRGSAKGSWLRAGRMKRLLSRDIMVVGTQECSSMKILRLFWYTFSETRLVVKNKGFESVLVMNGRIRVKRYWDSRQIITVTFYADLKKMDVYKG